jgi:maltose phosphorylase
MSDITIEGCKSATRNCFNIFQLNQTYLGKDSRLNIGPKGFTGENMVDQPIGILRFIVFHFIWLQRPTSSLQLINYRYNQLDKG